MNQSTQLNHKAWLLGLSIAFVVLGLSNNQAHDSDIPRGHDAPGDTSPPVDPNNGSDPEDYWGPPSGTSPTPTPNVEEQPTNTVSSAQVPPACQTHFDNYQGATSGTEIMVTLSALEKSIQEDTDRRIREFVSNLSCDDVREEAKALSHWEMYAIEAVVAISAAGVCSKAGFWAGTGCGLAVGAAAHACLYE